MHRFIARANIDHYLELVADPHLPPERHATIKRLLVTEEEKLSRDLEQLEFAETRAAKSRARLSNLRRLADEADTADRAQVERLVANFEAIQGLLDDFCHHLRKRLNQSGL